MVRRAEFESFLGGRVLLVAGVVVVLLGIGFFLHQAIQSGAIGPGMRTLLTALAGVAALVAGEFLRRRSLDVFAAALSGAGIGALFLATHFAANVHHFVGRPAGFFLAAVITAVGVVLGVMRESPFLTHLGFLGGWFAPALFGSPSESVWPLAGWLLLLDAGVLAIRCRLPYAGLDLMAAFASSIYLFLFATGPHHGFWTPTVLAWLALSLSRVAILVVPPWFLRVSPPWKALTAGVVAALVTVVIGIKLLFEDHRLALGLAILPLIAIYVAAAFFARQRIQDPERAARGYAAIAIVLMASVIPMLFSEVARAPVYATTAVALFVIGADARRVVPRLGGYAYLIFAVANAFEYRWPLHDEPFLVFLNAPFITHLICALATLASGRVMAHAARESEGRGLSALGTVAIAWLLGWELSSLVDLGDHAFLGVERDAAFAAAGWTIACVGWIAQRAWRTVDPELSPVGASLCALGAICALPAVEQGARVGDPLLLNPGVLVGAGLALVLAGSAWLARDRTRSAMSVALALWVLGVLTLDAESLGETGAFPGMQREDLRFLSLVVASIAWAANGAVWTWLGFRWRQQSARFAGMALLGITAAKVFLVDLAGLDTAWRAGSFLGLGVLLLAVSYLYHRAGRESSPRT